MLMTYTFFLEKLKLFLIVLNYHFASPGSNLVSGVFPPKLQSLSNRPWGQFHETKSSKTSTQLERNFGSTVKPRGNTYLKFGKILLGGILLSTFFSRN